MVVADGVEIGNAAERACFFVISAEIDMLDARRDDRTGTHGTRLKRHIEITPDQPPAAELAAGRVDSGKLRMVQRVFAGLTPVAAARDDLSVFYDDRADRRFAVFGCRFGTVERMTHEFFRLSLVNSHNCK